MKVLYEIQDILEDELKKICKKEEISSTDLENIYKMVDIVKDVTTVDAMHKAEQEGYSRDYARDYSRGYSDDYANAYGSYRRGRDAMGRFTSRDSSYDGYSRHSKDEMIEHLTEMMRNARSEDERESYRKAIEQMKR